MNSSLPAYSIGSAKRKFTVQPTSVFLVLCGVTFVTLLLSGELLSNGIWPALLLALVIATIRPVYGLGIAIFIAAIRQLPGISPSDMSLFHGSYWSYVGLRLLFELRPADLTVRRWKTMRAPLFLCTFAALLLIHNNLAFGSKLYIVEVGFIGAIMAIALTIVLADRLPPSLPAIIMTAILASCVTTIVYDAVLVYVPVAALAPEGAVVPPDMVRLAGVHINPNATAKFLAMGAVMLTAWAIIGRFANLKWRAIFWGLVGVFFMAIVATESKSTILGLAVAVAVVPFIHSVKSGLDMKRAASSLSSLCVMGIVVIAWTLGVGPPLKRHAASDWLGLMYKSRPDLVALAGVPKPEQRIRTVPMGPANLAREGSADEVWQSFASQFRIGHSFQMKGEVASQQALDSPFSSKLSTYSAKERKCFLLCTGQRDLLWSAGVQTVLENWFWGAGFGAWKKNLEAKLGFPFDSPHSGFLELWGEFGLAGAALYVGFATFVIWRACTLPLQEHDAEARPLLLGISMMALCMLCIELFEPAKFFAMSPHAIWIWTLLALQERTLMKRASAVQAKVV